MDADSWLEQHATWTSQGDPPGEDVSIVRQIVREALEDLAVEFEDAGGLELLSDVRLEVVVHGKPAAVVCNGETVHVGGGTALTCTGGRSAATIHILALSRHSPTAHTNVGEPMDRAYFHKTLVHEISILFLWRITRQKVTGWGMWTAPRWFYDGYEDYLSLIRSTPHSREVTLPKYRARAQMNLAAGAPVDVYVQGALILEYMHERFGHAKLVSLLRSEQPTFARALRATLGCDEVALLDGWRAWMKS